MDPKKYDQILKQEDYFRERYGAHITLECNTTHESKHDPQLETHSARMTIGGDSYVVRNNPIFGSDEKGAFYRQTDALINVRIKVVNWFKVRCNHTRSD